MDNNSEDDTFEKYLRDIEGITLNDFASKSEFIQEEIHNNYLQNWTNNKSNLNGR
uniref:hypothetical protein n=1 Tax=Clostridium sp. 12(A) TaxID=1163671 RepID=UPI0004B2EA62|nr:hypothetical protein [Clostridium sp. 12(A)]